VSPSPHNSSPAKRKGGTRKPAANMSRYEKDLKAQGFMRIAGVDEVGRGPLAGPLVAAAVILRNHPTGLRDSKTLTAPQRDRLYNKLINGGHAIGVGVIAPEEIDTHGLQRANYMAMLRAIDELSEPPDCVLVDGFEIPGCAVHQVRVVKGDARSFTIAASSIIAKVTRDRIMTELDRAYPGYGFAAHKGYGVRKHLDAITRLGPSPAHRKSFRPCVSGVETAELFELAERDSPPADVESRRVSQYEEEPK